MVTPSADHFAPTWSPIRFSGANSPAANAPGALDDRVDQVGRRFGEGVAAGQLVDPDDMAEHELLFVDGRRVGHGGSSPAVALLERAL